MPLFRRGQPPEALAAAIAGAKLGDRVLFAGTDDIRLVTEIATRAGLSGGVVLLAPDAARAADRAKRIEAAGALVEPEHAPMTMLPLDSESFDLAVAEETLLALNDAERAGAIAELYRVVRPGGRLLWIEREARGGLFGLVPSSRRADQSAREQMLRAAGFRGVRILAAVDGRVYIEGVRAAASN